MERNPEEPTPARIATSSEHQGRASAPGDDVETIARNVTAAVGELKHGESVRTLTDLCVSNLGEKDTQLALINNKMGVFVTAIGVVLSANVVLLPSLMALVPGNFGFSAIGVARWAYLLSTVVLALSFGLFLFAFRPSPKYRAIDYIRLIEQCGLAERKGQVSQHLLSMIATHNQVNSQAVEAYKLKMRLPFILAIVAVGTMVTAALTILVTSA